MPRLASTGIVSTAAIAFMASGVSSAGASVEANAGTSIARVNSLPGEDFVSGSIRVLEQTEHDHIVLMQGYARSVEQAHEQGLLLMRLLRLSCNEFAAGAFEDFGVVSRNAHLAAFSLMTYGDTCTSLSVLSPENCARLIQCGQALQDRVLDHELRYLQNDLSPSNAFYDDLFPLDVMGLPHKFVAAESIESGRATQTVLTRLSN